MRAGRQEEGMVASLKHDVQGPVLERLKTLGVKGVLLQMAKNGQILELRCEMPMCYCPNGREHFDPWPDPPYAPGHEWSPNADHHPTLKMDGGQLAVERAASARLLQQHRLRLAHKDPPHAREGSHALLRED